MGALDRRALTALWVLPLVFTLFNTSPLHLLWVAFPDVMQQTLPFAVRHSHGLLLAKAASSSPGRSSGGGSSSPA